MSVTETISIIEYPQAMDEYFSKNSKKVKTFPDEYGALREEEFPDIIISSTSQYIDFLNSEIEFWTQNDPKNLLSSFSKISTLKSAKMSFESAERYYQSNDNRNGDSYLLRSFNETNAGTLFSKTKFAQFLIKYVDEPSGVITGMFRIFSKNNTNSYSWSSLELKGSSIALEYLSVLKDARQNAEECIASIGRNTNELNENYAKLNQKYTISCHEHDVRLKDIAKQVDEFFTEKDRRATDLEKTYAAKLSLSKPAEYWERMAQSYDKKGKTWLGVSITIAAITIAMRVCVLIFASDIFYDTTNWLNLVKNSALITVSASIAIYIMRICVKMTMSSFHLSRDAEERHQLAGFYLCLISEKAVSDKERAIIINALFSRSETGLLHGESAPIMSADVSSILSIMIIHIFTNR